MKVKVCGGRDAFLGGKKIALMRESEQEDLRVLCRKGQSVPSVVFVTVVLL